MPIRLHGTLSGSPWNTTVSEGTHRVGRSPSNQVVLADPSVSREHAEIVVRGESIRVRDLGSRNGTWINDRRLGDEEPLASGDRLRFGSVTLVVDGAGGAASPISSVSAGGMTKPPPLADDQPALFASRAVGWEEARQSVSGSGANGRQLLDVLIETGNFLVVPRPREELYDALLAAVEKVVPARRLALLLYDSPVNPADEEVLPSVRAARPALAPGEELLLSRTLLRTVLVEQRSILVVDARTDDRYKNQASIMALDLRSALVAPLFDNERVIGVLYADTNDPRVHFDEDQLRVFALLANLVAVKISNSRLLDDLREKERMAQELETAARIQRELLPASLPDVPGFQLAATLVPCFEAGGDLYEASSLADGSCIVAVGDVSGKGMGAALVMSHTLSVLRMLQEEGLSLGDTAERLQRHVYRSTAPATFVTLFLGKLDPRTGRLDYVNCGHNSPLLFSPDGQVRELEVTGLPLGMLPADMMPPGCFDVNHVNLEPGGMLAIFSDGIPEAMGPGGFYGDEQTAETLRVRIAAPLSEVITETLADVDRFRAGTAASDDVTLLLVRRDPGKEPHQP